MEKWMLILLLVPFALGATINANSCLQTDVQAAIDSAADGDIVVIPAGTCTWSSTVTIPNTKGIVLQGAGASNTIIIDNTGTKSHVLAVSTLDGNSISRVTGIGFNNNLVDKDGLWAQVHIYGNTKQFRIDHCKFDNLNGRGIIASAGGQEFYGVIDNCYFHLPPGGHAQGIAVLGSGPQNDEPWTRPLTLGTEKAVYIEDNTFEFEVAGDGALDAYGGARYVFRHNYVHNTHAGHHGRDSGHYRSTLSFEYYGNTFYKDYGTGQRALFFRGGTGVVFNNTWKSEGASWEAYKTIELSNYCSCAELTSCSWGQCNTYPCLDQVGRAPDTNSDGMQELEPIYEWDNYNNGQDEAIGVSRTCALMAEHIQEGRDFYENTPRPGYMPYTYPHPLRAGEEPVCNPGCAGKECGPDGCGGDCGTCGIGETCQSGTCVVPQTGAYYVDNSGSCSDSASYGSESNPFCTIGYAVSQISGGDTIYVKKGTYNENLYITDPDGTAGSPTRILAYPGDTPILYGNGMNTGRVKFENADYLIFDGFEITNYNQGLFLDRCTNIDLLNLHIHHIGQQALTIHYDSSFVTVDSCTIHDTRQWQYNGEGIYIGTGSSGPVDNTHDITVRDCLIYNTVDEAIEFKGGTYNCIAENNVIHDSVTGSTWGAIEVNQHIVGVQQAIQEPRHIVRNNVLYNCDTAIRAGTSVQVYNNVIYDSDRGIYIDNQAGDSWEREVYHNTIDMPSADSVVQAGSQVDIRNNIGPTISGNIATGNYFTSDYHLLAGSAPINAGTNVGVATDLDGNARDSQPDMGAFEYGSCVEMTLSDLINVINQWKSGTKNINEVMQSIQRWKNGC